MTHNCAGEYMEYTEGRKSQYHAARICLLRHSIKVESLSYTMEDLIFRWELTDSLIVENAFELPQHNLIDYGTGICDQVYTSGNFTCVEVKFRLKRRIGYYIFHT